MASRRRGRWVVSKANLDGKFDAGDIAIGHATTGNTHTTSAGSTTTVFTNTKFDGGIGSTGFTVGDVVTALKKLGVLAL